MILSISNLDAVGERITANDLLGSLTGGGIFRGEFSPIIVWEALKGFVRFFGLDFQNYPGSVGSESLTFDALCSGLYNRDSYFLILLPFLGLEVVLSARPKF